MKNEADSSTPHPEPLRVDRRTFVQTLLAGAGAVALHNNLRGASESAAVQAPLKTPGAEEAREWLKLTGYADRFSAGPGETIRFMVSSEQPRFRADLVRLIHGDVNPKGPGFKEELIESSMSGEYPGRAQSLRAGSYVAVPDAPALRLKGSFTLQAWVAASTLGKGVQAIVTKWVASERKGYALVIEEDGSLALWIGDENGRVAVANTS